MAISELRIITCTLAFAFLGSSNDVSAAKPATPNEIPVRLFAQLPNMINPSLSPDGERIAYLSGAPRTLETPFPGRYHLVVQSLVGAKERNFRPPHEALEFDSLRWVSNERLLILMSYRNLDTKRLASVDRDGNDFEFVMKKDWHDQSQIIDWMPENPDQLQIVLFSVNKSPTRDVYRLNIPTGRLDFVMAGVPGVRHWIVDQSGAVRFGYGYTQNRGFRAGLISIDGDWIEHTKSPWWEQGFRPVAFTAEPTVAYVLGPNDKGFRVLRKLDIATGDFKGTVFEHEQYDARGLVYDPLTAQPVGVTYTDHILQTEYFEPAFKLMQNSLQQAYPEQQVEIVDMTADRRIVLVRVSSPTDPGVLYMWNRDTRHIEAIAEQMPGLEPRLMSAPQPVTYEARDGTPIPAYLTTPLEGEAKGLPAVLLVHDGPATRDDASFSFLTQFLVSRGYAVLQPNFRGSSGYGEAYKFAGYQQWGGLMQDDVTDGAHWLIETGIADPQRLAIMGEGYGGYAAAMAPLKTPDLFRCAASMNGFYSLPFLVAERGKWRSQSIGLTGQSLKSVSPLHNASKMSTDTPLLLLDNESNWYYDQQAKRMFRRMQFFEKPVALELLEHNGASNLNNSAVRLALLYRLQEFLERNLGGR